jgi:ACS family sodium-dependent inorganic phosphate cotransporter
MASSFYWGYFLSHLPAGFLADQFGGKHVVSASIVGGACISLVIPTTIVFTNGRYQTVFLLRVLEGIFHGAVHPSICAILAQWTLKKDRAAVMSFVYASAPMGIATNTLVGKEIMELTHTWTTPFYLFGALGILMFLLWHFLCYSSPESHPWITTQEKEFLRNGLGKILTRPVRVCLSTFQTTISCTPGRKSRGEKCSVLVLCGGCYWPSWGTTGVGTPWWSTCATTSKKC